MDEVREHGGQPLVDEHWARIQVGTYYHELSKSRLWRRILHTVGPRYLVRRARDMVSRGVQSLPGRAKSSRAV